MNRMLEKYLLQANRAELSSSFNARHLHLQPRSARSAAPSAAAFGAVANVGVATVVSGRGNTSMKAGDEWCLPLCKMHHIEQHNAGVETFQRRQGIDMIAIAQEFARKNPYLQKLRRELEATA